MYEQLKHGRAKSFYSDIGFTKASEAGGIAYFHFGCCSFLLQDFYDKSLAENLMMHVLVEDTTSWHEQILQAGVAEKSGVKVSSVTEQPWGMFDFVVHDPSGVLWRFGRNV